LSECQEKRKELEVLQEKYRAYKVTKKDE